MTFHNETLQNKINSLLEIEFGSFSPLVFSMACNSCQNEKRLHCVYIFILLYFFFIIFLFRVKREKFRNNRVINRENRHRGTTLHVHLD